MDSRRRLELGVVVLVFAGIALIYSNGYQAVLATIEGYTFQRNVEEMRTAAALTFLEAHQSGRRQTLRSLEGDNPVSLMEKPPSGYRGEFEELSPDRVEPGEWYFDTRAGLLIYRVEFVGRFEGGRRDPVPHARLRLKAEPREGAVSRLDVTPVDEYRWRDREG